MDIIRFLTDLSKVDPLSLRLILVTGVALGLACSFFLFGSALSTRFLSVQRRKFHPGRKTRPPLSSDHYWSLGTFSVTLGLGMVSLQGLVPALISILGSNIFLLGGILLISRGLRTFSGRKTLGWAFLAYLSAYALATAYLTFLRPSVQGRIILFSLATCLVLVDATMTVFLTRGDRQRRASVLAGAIFSFLGLFFGIRAIASIFVSPGSLLSPSLLSTLTFVFFCLGVVTWTLSLILLRNERLLSEVLRAEGLYRGLFENAAVGLFQSSPEGNFIRINAAFARIFGYPSAQALLADRGSSTAWVYGDQEVRSSLLKLLKTQGSFEEAEVRTVSKDGSTIWVSVNASLVGLGGGEAVITGSMVDITDRRREGEALAQARDEKVLLLQELQHRVKNGMGVIASLVGLEAGRFADEAVKEALEGLESKVSALSSLYDLLQRSGDTSTIGLDVYLARLADNFASSHGLAERGIVLETRLEAVEVSLKRAESLGLVAVELLTDALKHAFPGGRKGSITLGLARQGEAALLTVEDNGVGLPVGFLPEKSAGLGMAIVATLADQLDGSFEASSREGGGTRFTLSFVP